MFAMTHVRLQIAVIVGAAFAALLAALLVLAAFSSTANATHSWSDFHWGRTANPFAVRLDDNLTTTAWKTHLVTASSSVDKNDWTDSSVLDTTIAPSTNTKQCQATSGRVEVCNAKYGSTGWIGLASVWTSGGHIVQGTAKMNDSYSMTSYTKQQVMCQEVGHTFGLGHQDTSRNSAFNSCMTYDKATATDDQWPDSHDYAQLEGIYTIDDDPNTAGHADSTTTVGSTSAASKLPPAALAINTADPSQRGQLVHRSPNGRVEIYERDFGRGHKVITRVIRSDEETPPLDEQPTAPGGGVAPHGNDGHDH